MEIIVRDTLAAQRAILDAAPTTASRSPVIGSSNRCARPGNSSCGGCRGRPIAGRTPRPPVPPG